MRNLLEVLRPVRSRRCGLLRARTHRKRESLRGPHFRASRQKGQTCWRRLFSRDAMPLRAPVTKNDYAPLLGQRTDLQKTLRGPLRITKQVGRPRPGVPPRNGAYTTKSRPARA